MTMSHKEALEKAGQTLPMYSPSNDDLTDFIRSYLDARGLVMVPKEPAQGMLAATEEVAVGYDDFSCGDGTIFLSYPGFHDYAIVVYRAMLAAAPDPFGGE